MRRSRYKIYEPASPHFMTCTVQHRIPIFTRRQSVQIVLDNLAHLMKRDDLNVYAYVMLENHLHLIAQSSDIAHSMHKFKSYTAHKIVKLLKAENIKTILEQLEFYKKAHK